VAGAGWCGCGAAGGNTGTSAGSLEGGVLQDGGCGLAASSTADRPTGGQRGRQSSTVVIAGLSTQRIQACGPVAHGWAAKRSQELLLAVLA